MSTYLVMLYNNYIHATWVYINGLYIGIENDYKDTIDSFVDY